VILRLRTVAPLVVLFAASLAGWSVAAAGLRFNSSPSVPVGFYRLVDEPVAVGSLVAACLPERDALFGRRRGYLHAGPCPGDAAAVVKRVGAVGGDVVRVSPNGVFVDGSFLEKEAPMTDSQGRPLVPLLEGTWHLGCDHLWLYSDHANSWDSRFYGPVHRSAVLGTVRPLWTASSASPAPAVASPGARR
jgi:conjugative transfer signal peptidase TraF